MWNGYTQGLSHFCPPTLHHFDFLFCVHCALKVLLGKTSASTTGDGESWRANNLWDSNYGLWDPDALYDSSRRPTSELKLWIERFPPQLNSKRFWSLSIVSSDRRSGPARPGVTTKLFYGKLSRGESCGLEAVDFLLDSILKPSVLSSEYPRWNLEFWSLTSMKNVGFIPADLNQRCTR